jgi:hypothetical protein
MNEKRTEQDIIVTCYLTAAIAFQSKRPSFMVKVNKYTLRLRLRKEEGTLLPHT